MDQLRRAAGHFGIETSDGACEAFGDGLINETWKVGGLEGDFLLQRINQTVFPDAVLVAENAATVARRVGEALDLGGDPDPRKRLVFLTGAEGLPWFRDDEGGVWRAAKFIPASRPADPRVPSEVCAAARALGRFPGLVASGSGQEPQVVIAGFHDTPARLEAFIEAVSSNPGGRRPECRDEISRLLGLGNLVARISAADLPDRFIHNDAKLDNVLVDTATGAALCVIDLDTVMPGKTPHDFGDLVRSAVTGRPEDEPDLDLISVPEETFACLCEGYLAGAKEWIGPEEKSLLFDGALVITFEQALRFLTDHLEGDVYYRVADPAHNLRRARAQLRLLEELLKNEGRLRNILELS